MADRDQGRLFRAMGDTSSAAMRLMPETWNAEDRSVVLLASMGGDVTRRDWRDGSVYIERLRVDAESVDLSRLNSGIAPLLDTHDMYDTSTVRGVVVGDSARIEGGGLIVTVVLSDADGDAEQPVLIAAHEHQPGALVGQRDPGQQRFVGRVVLVAAPARVLHHLRIRRTGRKGSPSGGRLP